MASTLPAVASPVRPVWAARHLGAVGQGGDREVGEDVRRDPEQLVEAGHGEPTDLHVGVLGGAHSDEVPPGTVVAGDHDAGLGRVRQYRARRLPRLLAPRRGVWYV